VLRAFALLGAGYEHIGELAGRPTIRRPASSWTLVATSSTCCASAGAPPTVVLEAAHGGAVAHWVRVQWAVADAARATVYAYDVEAERSVLLAIEAECCVWVSWTIAPAEITFSAPCRGSASVVEFLASDDVERTHRGRAHGGGLSEQR
jgi:hypothetical protein